MGKLSLKWPIPIFFLIFSYFLYYFTILLPRHKYSPQGPSREEHFLGKKILGRKKEGNDR